MEFDSLVRTFLSNQQAVLPSAVSQYWGLYGAWAVLLAWGVLAMSKRWPNGYRWGIAGAVLVVTCVPGPTSPAYWLGLAFQSPSVSTVLLACWSVSKLVRGRSTTASTVSAWPELVACAVGAVLGWVLLLDTLAWWPVSIYAWGFSPVAVASLSVVLALCWARWGGAQKGGFSPLVFGVPAMALALFVVTRWPTGNVWDALIDPWLWVGLQWMLLISALRGWRQRGSQAIRV